MLENFYDLNYSYDVLCRSGGKGRRLSHLKLGGTSSVASNRTTMQGDYTSNQKMD